MQQLLLPHSLPIRPIWLSQYKHSLVLHCYMIFSAALSIAIAYLALQHLPCTNMTDLTKSQKPVTYKVIAYTVFPYTDLLIMFAKLKLAPRRKGLLLTYQQSLLTLNQVFTFAFYGNEANSYEQFQGINKSYLLQLLQLLGGALIKFLVKFAIKWPFLTKNYHRCPAQQFIAKLSFFASNQSKKSISFIKRLGIFQQAQQNATRSFLGQLIYKEYQNKRYALYSVASSFMAYSQRLKTT